MGKACWMMNGSLTARANGLLEKPAVSPAPAPQDKNSSPLIPAP